MIDLHTHSYYSDGLDSPFELLSKAKLAGVNTIAITDHDTMRGIEEAQVAALTLGLKLIKGIEVSSFDEDLISIHVLGLNIKDADIFYQLEINNQASRNDRNQYMINFLKDKYNINFSIEDLRKEFKGTVGNGNLKQYLKNKSYAISYQEANDMLYECKCTSPYGMHIKEVISLIHRAGGLAFVAHPIHLRLSDDDLIKKLKQLQAYGLDGLECYHSDHDKLATQKYLKIAHDLGLKVSGGSDYHGAFKSNVHLGVGRGSSKLVDEAICFIS